LIPDAHLLFSFLLSCFGSLATLGADFYHQTIPISDALVQPLQNGSYPWRAPDPLPLQGMIVRPAERAGLQVEGDMALRLLRDTGPEPGALALMAHLLDELYRRREADLGGVRGRTSASRPFYGQVDYSTTCSADLFCRSAVLPPFTTKSRGPKKQVRATLPRPEFLPILGSRKAVNAQNDSAVQFFRSP
jgi:hypothetical protein